MKVTSSTGDVIELGPIETSPTIGIIDYSRRVTDDYGVTTVVQRAFSRRMQVRLAVPFDDTGMLQRRLAALRATPATWTADDRFASLSVRGFYKDFEVDHAVPPLSYCTLTVEGLAETAPIADAGGDPAISGKSTLQLLQPVTITTDRLIASSVPEADAAEWSAQTTYALGARVMKAATHRVYEAAIGGNVGNDPAGASGKWIDIGPTNRWAMFDQALGSLTSAANTIAVTLDAPAIQAVALLDVTAATVRLQAVGYDRTVSTGAGSITFLDLPAGTTRVTVTIAGSAVSVGTLLIGKLVGLGVTEASPTSGITDYSRKDVDQFGAVTIVQRAWSKRMAAKSLIDTAAIDIVASRIAAVRAVPSLWIGLDGLDSLTVYGFFKEFSIEVGETTSKLSLSIEGLSTAGKIEPLGTQINWPDIADPTGTKPTDNADKTSDNTAKDTTAVNGRPANQVIAAVDKAKADIDGLVATFGTTASAAASADAARDAKTNAETAAVAAQGARDAAQDARALAGGSATTAIAARDAASQAKTDAQTASTASASARDAANSARDLALGYRDAAQGGASTATSAATSAAAARDAATQKASDAAVSATSAGGSATTASGQATIATQKADAAGQSASTASAKADVATTQAGTATTKASEAATSATNALGSSSSAASSATVAASSYASALSAAIATMPDVIKADLLSGSVVGAPETRADLTAAWVANAVYSPAPGASRVVAFKGVVPWETGKIYEVAVEVAVDASSEATPNASPYARGLDANYGGLLDYYIFTPTPAGQTTRMVVRFGLGVLPPSAPGIGTRQIAFTSQEFVRFGALINYSNIQNQSRLGLLTIRDVTQALASAASATASATSASNASISQTAAGTSATAAKTSETNAGTSAGTATTKASEASTSAANALGSANSASASQTVAASSAGAALASASLAFPDRLTMNGDYFAGGSYVGDPSAVGMSAAGKAKIINQANVGPVYQLAATGVEYFATRGVVPTVDSRIYEVEFEYEVVTYAGTPFSMNMWVINLNGAYAQFGTNTAKAYTTNSAGVKVTTLRFSSTAPTGGLAWAAGASFVRPMVGSQSGVQGSDVRIRRVSVRDITDSLATQASAAASAGSASTASTQATNAGTSATAALASATTATTKAGEASTSATNASTSESNALGFKNAAASSATVAATARDDAVTAKNAAGDSATAAANSASSAAASKSGADQSASAAKTSETNAGTSAGTASTKATEAATSTASALGYANSASASQTVAASSATVAKSALAQMFPTSLVGAALTYDYANFNSAELTGSDLPVGGVMSTGSPGSGYPHGLFLLKTVPAIVGATWRVRANLAQDTGPSAVYAIGYAVYFRADGSYITGATIGSQTNYAKGQGVRGDYSWEWSAGAGLDPAIAFVRFGVLLNRTASLVTFAPPFTTKVYALYPEDVTSEKAAAASATASAGSASSASTSKDAAGVSATAAKASETNAGTSAGTASTKATEASTSASNALGSSTSASSSAIVAASSATTSQATAASLLPDSMRDKSMWRRAWQGPDARAQDLPTSWNFNGTTAVHTAVSTTVVDLANVGSVKLVPGRRRRITATWRVLAAPSGATSINATLFFIGLDGTVSASGTTTPSLVVGISSASATGWIGSTGYARHTFEINDDVLIAVAGTVNLRGLLRVAPDAAGCQFEVLSFDLDDITSEAAAAGSATAAAGSASLAKTSETNAGQSASAALASQTAANTSAGSASTFATQASTSAGNALGSANSAATQAGAAAGSATTAGQKATAAATSEQNAASSATTAGQQASASEASKTAAVTARGQAETFANQASTSKDSAAASASTASTQAGLAAQSKTDAQSANAAAAASATAANTSAGTASTKADAAGVSAQAANQAKLDAQAAQGSATASASAANGSAVAASGSASSAQTSATISSSYSSAAININDKFGNWPNPTAYPVGWSAWASGGNYRFQQSPGLGSAYSLYTLNDSPGVDSGFQQAITLHNGLWVVEATVTKMGGTWSGSGISISAAKNWHFATETDTSGLSASNTPDGSTRTWSKLFRFNGEFNAAGTLYGMLGWSQFGGADPKYLAWKMLRIRPATAGDIAADKALNDSATNAARIEQVNSTLTDIYGSLSQRTTNVEARAGSVEARTGIVETAVASATSKLAAARVEISAVSPGGRASMTVRSDTINGAAIDFGADLNIVGNIKVQRTVGGKTIMIDSDTGITFNNGTIMKVMGVGFGSANQFVEWMGPSLSTLAQCTEANGYSYTKTDGSGYYGGGLSAGTLKNSVASSDLAAAVTTSVGPFGSNGKVVRYIASWSYTSVTNATYPATATGLQQYNNAVASNNATSDGAGGHYGVTNTTQPNSTVTLSRMFAGQAAQQLDQRTYSSQQSSFAGRAPVVGDTPGQATITTTIGGGATIADPTLSAANRTLTLTLARGFTSSSTNLSQRLSIVSVEE